MPGNSLIAGGGSSLGKASASPSVDVSHEVMSEKGTDGAQQKDPMPGNSLIAKGGSFLGKTSASPSSDSSLNSTVKNTKPRSKRTMRLLPVTNSGSCARKDIVDLTSDNEKCTWHGVSDGFADSSRDTRFLNPMFPKVTVSSIGGQSKTRSSKDANDVELVIKTAILNCSQVDFSRQTLITMMEGQDQDLTLKADLNNVSKIINGFVSVERNIIHQLYMLQDLRASYHCTVPTQSLENIMSSWPSRSQSSSIRNLHIPSSSNYASLDNQIVVINTDQSLPQFHAQPQHGEFSKRPLETLTQMMKDMFLAGLSDYFEYNNKKRSSSSKSKSKTKSSANNTKRNKRPRSTSFRSRNNKKQMSNDVSPHKDAMNVNGVTKHVFKSNIVGCNQREVQLDPNALPVITLGWTTLDCNRYASNLASVAGNIKPFIRDGNLPKNVKQKIVDIVEAVLRFLPGEWAFNIDKCGDDEMRKLRSSMVADFKEVMCGDRDISYFRVEGISILIPLSIGLHKDTLNCSAEGMRSVISINCQIPMNEETISDGKGSRLWLWLLSNGYATSFPCSIILYSRKVVHHYCNKLSLSNKLAAKDTVRKCLNWAMIKRVGSVTDYRSRIWNSTTFPNLFKKHSRKIKTSRFRGLLWPSPACYDKTVSDVITEK